MEAFRQEIIETQKARSDLLKWKLIISASLGAIGLNANPLNSSDLGSSNYDSPVDLAFCLIPFVCTYVDLLCYHLNLRMFVINKFFNRLQVKKPKKNNEQWTSLQDIYLFRKYEETCKEVRSVFHLESLALKWSTIIISLLIIGISYYAHDRSDAFWLVTAGSFGVLAAFNSETVYNERAKDLQDKILSPIYLINELYLKSQIIYSNYSSLKSRVSRKEKRLYPSKTILQLCYYAIFIIGFAILILFVFNTQNFTPIQNGEEKIFKRNIAEGIIFIGSGVLLLFCSTLIESFFYRNNKLRYSVNKKNPWDWWLGIIFVLLTGIFFWGECFSLLEQTDIAKEKIFIISSVNELIVYVGITLVLIDVAIVCIFFFALPKNQLKSNQSNNYHNQFMLISKNKRLILNNEMLLDFIKFAYKKQEINNLSGFLQQQGTFNYYCLKNGLFPAAILSKETQYTGYSNVWIRDNIYVAYSYYLLGQIDVATKNVKTFMAYFQKYKQRFEAIIDGQVNSEEIMKRPNIRFDGRNLEEIDQEWHHAQNDALGYFLWFYCKLVKEGYIQPNLEDLETLALFPCYFQSIHYWRDEDSGHWEEDRKIEASSIGVVVAGLKELKQLLLKNADFSCHCKYKGVKSVTIEFLDELIDRGITSLNKILPSECIQPVPQQRRYDAALLFLIYPLEVVEGEMADQILNDVIENLQGDYGIRRYLEDSFWCRDYKDIPEEIRTTISSEREQWFKENDRELVIGEEAQWCIFDPIVSAIFGLKFQETGQQEYLEQQIHYLNRSLGQLTGKDCQFGEFKCPELYYLQHGQYVPNDVTPLLWTQANLRIALKMMEQSLSYSGIQTY